ncbi:relaxase/mobilization nuclease domain-containing protein [Methylobacterium sp.]|uniref:relaxase/mobilization nuclease domain-containing protein n=2 Tax=Pseudomonadota TaxID=1224 RepID=UPI003B5CFE07
MGPIRGASLCLHTVWDGTVIRAPWCRLLPQFQQTPRFRRHSPQKPALSGGLPPMSADDDNRFRPKPGRIRSDASKAGQAKSFLTKVRKIARQHGADSGRTSRSGSVGGGGKPGRNGAVTSGRGVKRGRGAAFVRSRNLSNAWSHRQAGSRRVIVKSRSVRAAGKSGKAAAHLRYIQRDGTSRDGERGRLYSATEGRADGDAFLDRGKDDRHQFRFIVSPEDAADIEDLTGHTRDLMARVEADLGTKLDWVAVNHFNTGHPHVHVIVNGRDDMGEDLVINGDYLANGVRERASELATLELGPVTEIEQRRKLTAEIDQDRFTRIDRAMVNEAAEDGRLDLRHAPENMRGQEDRTLRLRRLGKLEKMGLATEQSPGVWELGDRLESTLRDLGERGDIVRTMQKAMRAEGHDRDPISFQIYDTAPATPVVGRVIDKHLSDELGENLTLVIDGTDGRTHHISGVDQAKVADVRIGSVIEIGATDAGSRPSDRTIASMVEDGIYRPSRHLEQARFNGRVPGSDYDGFVDAHVRRLEALRRAGIAERIDADQWRIPQDFEARAAAHDAGRGRQLNIRVLSTFDLEKQIMADGATWLDRKLVGRGPSDIAQAGFGQDVSEAMGRRRERLVEQGDATRQQNGRVLYRRDLLTTLEAREVARAGAELTATKPIPFRAAGDGETVSGTFTGTVQLASGKFAIVEKSHEFTLVPWRPVIDRQLGREVMGVVQGRSVSWQLGRKMQLGL